MLSWQQKQKKNFKFKKVSRACSPEYPNSTLSADKHNFLSGPKSTARSSRHSVSSCDRISRESQPELRRILAAEIFRSEQCVYLFCRRANSQSNLSTDCSNIRAPLFVIKFFRVSISYSRAAGIQFTNSNELYIMSNGRRHVPVDLWRANSSSALIRFPYSISRHNFVSKHT